MNIDFTDQVVLITGSTRNTGYQIALAFAQAGATVVLNGTTAEAVTKAAASIAQVTGATTIEAPGCIDNPADVEAIFRTIDEKAGRIDVLISNAVIQGLGHDFLDTPLQQVQQVMAINVNGLFHVAQQAARRMVAAGAGSIVNIGSNVSTRAIKHRTAYCASKAAVDGLTRAMAVDLAPHNIRVNVVAAGYINTERWDTLPAAHAERRRKNIPLGAEAQGSDIARAAMFLASPAAGNVTGARLVVDGGCTAQHMPPDVDL